MFEPKFVFIFFFQELSIETFSKFFILQLFQIYFNLFVGLVVVWANARVARQSCSRLGLGGCSRELAVGVGLISCLDEQGEQVGLTKGTAWLMCLR